MVLLEVESKVFYPAHGAGWIKSKKVIEFAGQKRQYFEFEFINNSITISTPVENLDQLNIRAVYNSDDIRQSISVLKEEPTVKPPTLEYNQLINIIRDLDMEGQTNSFVEIIQYGNYVIKVRGEEGRLIPASIKKYIKNSIKHLADELAVANDLSLEEAAQEFEKISGMEYPN